MIRELKNISRMMSDHVASKRYQKDIVAYARERKDVWMWGRLREACEAIVTPPHKVMIESANGVGKTLFIGMCISWFHESFDPGQGIVTAPNFRQIQRTSWKEARGFLRGCPGLKPRDPSIYHHERHRFDGFTSTDATGFQGTHDQSLMLIFEEATGIDASIWTATRGISAGGEVFQIAALNPTDSTSAAKAESESGTWKVIRISAFEHPNVIRRLCGMDDVIPGAVTLGYSESGDHVALMGNMIAWGDRAGTYSDTRQGPGDVDLHSPEIYGFNHDGDPLEVDRHGTTVTSDQVIEGAKKKFPARFWRPGPDGEARICGRYPSQAAYAIFSEASLDRSFSRRPEIDWSKPIVGGCDVARFGDDRTSVWIKVGRVVIRHEVRSKQGTDETAGLLKALCREYGPRANRLPWKIPIHIDDTGVGGGVVDQAWSDEVMSDGEKIRVRYNFIPVNFGQKPRNKSGTQKAQALYGHHRYPNARSEILFNLSEMLDADEIDLGHVPQAHDVLRRQATQVKYRLDADGRRVAEPKDMMKKRVGGSPDELDGLGLACYALPSDAWVEDSLPAAKIPETRREIDMGTPSESRDRYFGPRGGSR